MPGTDRGVCVYAAIKIRHFEKRLSVRHAEYLFVRIKEIRRDGSIFRERRDFSHGGVNFCKIPEKIAEKFGKISRRAFKTVYKKRKVCYT